MIRNTPREFVVTVASDKIRFILPDGQVLCEKDNIVILDSEDKIVEIGESPESMQKQFPAMWQKMEGEVTLLNPFSNTNFNPYLATTLLDHIAFRVLRDKFKKGSVLFRDKLAWNIVFPGYDELDQHAKDRFEFYMATPGFVVTKSLRINDVQRDIQVFLDAQSFLKNLAFLPGLAVFVMLWAFANGMFAPVFLPGRQSGLVFLPVMGLCWFVGSFLLLLIWKAKYQNGIPYEMIMAMLGHDRFGLSGAVVNWLFDRKKQV
ncbi:MAG: hypothetical protein CVU44_02200 [Chloroflexi bacterium HGW-Chloroflexi-6]|nr:MAG: hypothetical protein CVU44_02200 [Chloroflexi bacterium HGW-Chloroflexi-6]